MTITGKQFVWIIMYSGVETEIMGVYDNPDDAHNSLAKIRNGVEWPKDYRVERFPLYSSEK